MRTYDFHRGLVTALAAGVAGFLVWLATQIGQQTTGRFWASMGIVAGAGLVLAISQLLGGWTKWGLPRMSLGVFLLGFLPVLVCVGWIMLATQPGGRGFGAGRLVDWSQSIGIYGIVHELGLYHGALAFALGLVLGYTLDTAGRVRRAEAVADRAVTTTGPAMDRRVADEPLEAERQEVGPQLATVGRTTDENDEVLVADRQVEIREGGKRVVPEQPDPFENRTE
jgi:hypothetical protein